MRYATTESKDKPYGTSMGLEVSLASLLASNTWSVGAKTAGIGLGLVVLHAAPSSASFPSLGNAPPNQNFLYSSKTVSYKVAIDPVIREFMLKKPWADIGAIQQIFDKTTAAFTASGVNKKIDVSFEIEDEEAGARLVLRVDTHGMDFDKQSEIDFGIREAIFREERLLHAKKYMSLSVW